MKGGQLLYSQNLTWRRVHLNNLMAPVLTSYIHTGDLQFFSRIGLSYCGPSTPSPHPSDQEKAPAPCPEKRNLTFGFCCPALTHGVHLGPPSSRFGIRVGLGVSCCPHLKEFKFLLILLSVGGKMKAKRRICFSIFTCNHEIYDSD